MTAAGVISSCNPADAGYQPMYAAAGNGSWLGIIPGAPAATSGQRRPGSYTVQRQLWPAAFSC